MMQSREKAIMRDGIQLLETSVQVFTTKLGSPLFIKQEGKDRFRFARPTSLHLQVLRAARIVSGLNACLELLQKGYAQEIGVILRTIDDFVGDIQFLHEAHATGKPDEYQQRFVKEFFSKELLTAEERWKKLKNLWMLPRRRVFAGLGRLFERFTDPGRTIRLSKIVNESLSGYVHGAYSQTMELYGGGTDGFNMDGMSVRIPEWRSQIAIYIHRALNVFAEIAINMGLLDLKNALIEKRREFERSKDYAE